MVSRGCVFHQMVQNLSAYQETKTQIQNMDELLLASNLLLHKSSELNSDKDEN